VGLATLQGERKDQAVVVVGVGRQVMRMRAMSLAAGGCRCCARWAMRERAAGVRWSRAGAAG
jgi:hypothetical protein